jgi:hypothetical protein
MTPVKLSSCAPSDEEYRGRIASTSDRSLQGIRSPTVPQRLSDEEFATLLTEDDVFKLAIRGQAAVQAEIDAAITETFVDDAPKNLETFGGFETRLDLAVALGVVSSRSKPLIKALAELRDRFAQGDISDLSPQRADALRRKFPSSDLASELAGDLRASLKRVRPRVTLVYALILARASIDASATAARRRRDEADHLVEAYQRRLHELRRESPRAVGYADAET